VIWPSCHQLSFTLFPTSWRLYTFGEHPRKSTIRNAWFQQ
jgi:hypothetical protein